MSKTATEMREIDFKIDKRRIRASSVLCSLLEFVRPHLRDDADLSQIAQSILTEAHRVGAEFVTDHDRARLGLPPRDGKGWTDEEIVAYECARLELMTRPLVVMMPNDITPSPTG